MTRARDAQAGVDHRAGNPDPPGLSENLHVEGKRIRCGDRVKMPNLVQQRRHGDVRRSRAGFMGSTGRDRARLTQPCWL